VHQYIIVAPLFINVLFSNSNGYHQPTFLIYS
jgi:hypothetical protein